MKFIRKDVNIMRKTILSYLKCYVSSLLSLKNLTMDRINIFKIDLFS